MHLTYVDSTAAQLLASAEALTGLERVPLAAGDPLLYGAQATLDDGFIYYNAEAEPWLTLFYQAHEFAHHWLHRGATLCSGEDVDYTEAEDKPLYGEARIEAYGPHQRREREANLFAREFLLPGDLLRRLFVEENLNAAQIAERTGVRLDFAMHALAHALLTPDMEEADASALDGTTNDAPPPAVFALDDSQRRAAESAHTPLLVAAGPGTGKTRALVGRILHLLETGAAPISILALTFSNKAAEELRERVQRHAPEAAPHIETHTFHSFGLELLRRYWQPAGLNPRPVILDPVDALFILERHLPELGLDHYQNIYEPTKNLSSILAAISRAKDELCDPQRYRQLAEKMRDEAQTSDDNDALRRAGRAMEVARVYDFYQTYLEREGLLDFGDLIARSVRLLRESRETCDEVQGKYRHVLVDEYQDVNRACGVLLRLMTREGAGLWAVGDARQAIYRWRGAAPAQVRHFRRDFPAGEITPLSINYRSVPSIVKTVSAFAGKMRVAPSSDQATGYDNLTAWQAHRQGDEQTNEDANKAGKPLRFEIATNRETEARCLARLIKERRKNGTPYKSQAVICRKHSQLAKFAKALEAENVPALYLGDIFERSEVRDLLAFVALVCEPSGRTLLRVARFPEYDIPLADVRALLKAAREAGIDFPSALIDNRLDITHAASPRGAEGFARLADHLTRVAHIPSAWKLLAHYLFIHSRYLAPLLADTTIAGAQKRLAIHQLLQFAHTQADRAVATTRDADARRALLAYVRRLKMFAEDKGLRQTSIAENLDGVHLVTVHAAKGLEWDTVHLPHLGKGHFPNRRKTESCPPPDGMVEILVDGKDAPDTHTEEEECLFFVALSRARDRLCLTRATLYGGTNSKTSEFLEHLGAHLPGDADGAATWRDEPSSAPLLVPAITLPVVTLPRATDSAKPRFTERALANYMKCPRKYFYENVIYLRGKSEESAYVRFHACVYAVLRLLANEKSAGRLNDIEHASKLAHRRLTEVWRESGLAGHVYESFYSEQAALMVERAVRRIKHARGTLLEQDWTVTRPHARVHLTLDHIELIEDRHGATLLMQHSRTGRPPSKPPDDSLYGLYYSIASEHFPAALPRIEVLYLSTDEIVVLDLKPRTIATRLGHYDEAIDSILAGEFPPAPSEHSCPRCAHYFTCPKAEDGK